MTDDAERKQVTVLFADVMGSMDLAEQHDPEEWRAIMQRFFSILADAVTEFEGTVDKFTGDGIMAVFGAPVAHEDHAQRACYAALRMLADVAEYAAELRRAEGLNFSVRVGASSGEVVAGAIAEAAGGDYTAIGHTVGLAQRMEALAEPGKAYLTEHTAALAEGFLELEDLGEFGIKGASQPVRVFELAGIGSARSRLDLSRQRGFSRFVGRVREMEALDQALAAADGGEGGLVAIAAEPGAGKSRLCHEFAQRCRERGLEVFEAQAQAHGTSIPFMPVLQMLRAYFGIADREPGRASREKIAGRTLLLDPGFAEDLPLLFDFLGIPDPDRPPPQISGEAKQRALRGIVCRLAGSPARRHTIVIVVEDLHWIDEGSESMLAALAGAIDGTQTLVVVNFRPEYTPPWPSLPSHRQLSLGPLEPADTRELLRDIAGEDPSLDGLEEPVHERAAGNPFFVEEIVRELAETGLLEGERGAYRLAGPIEDGGVPASVQAILAARIDRLEPAQKALLQVASVIGREFGERALQLSAGAETEELGDSLAALADAGFLYEAELYPERVLAFRHPLTREVAYGSQLAERRRATHAAVARATIELEAQRLDELAALVAHHWEEGDERLQAAHWYARAAHWAGHSRPQDALRLWQRVTELADGLEPDAESEGLALVSRLLQLDYAWRLGMERERAESLAAEAGAIATRTGDLRSQVLLQLLTAVRPGVDGHSSEWIEAARATMALADEAGDRDLRVAVRCAACYTLMCGGELEAVLETADEMLALAAGDTAVGAGIVIGSPLAWGPMAKSLALREMGRVEEAEACADEALRLAEDHGDPETASWSRGAKSSLLCDRGEAEAGLDLARRNCELTEQLGDVFSRSLALCSVSYAEHACGEAEAALASIELADRLYREAMGVGGETEAWRSTLKAQALLALDRLEEAVAEAEWTVETARSRGMFWQLPHALHLLAQARAAAGLPGVEEALDEGIEVSRRLGHGLAQARIEADRSALT
ncbi:MAG TPA: adenylate/guanylate cyclase domain-containing protein [Solirubrobacterales bacterium]|nr:adenylate/guanylate cyclase domain-containing protein [Solirubrobacterales bacterium]